MPTVCLEVNPQGADLMAKRNIRDVSRILSHARGLNWRIVPRADSSICGSGINKGGWRTTCRRCRSVIKRSQQEA